ncbi:MAG: pseudouridine synthase [Bacteroidota bacterium]
MNKNRHFLLHKPYGYLSQFINNQSRRKNKKLLGELYDFPAGTMSIGRLDQNSEGLLLLTTEGLVSAQVRSKRVEKEYYIQVDGEITEDAIEQLKNGINIKAKNGFYLTLPCKANRLKIPPIFERPPRKVRHEKHGPTSWASVTITEGKFRQVRKMSAAVGFPTLRLVRVRIGNIHLGQLQAGEVLEVEKFDVEH